jgi:hypothetical protein
MTTNEDKPSRGWQKIAAVSAFLIFGGLILVLSLARAGLSILAVENQADGLRVKPIKFAVDKGKGQMEWYSYKIPNSGMRRDSWLYWIKDIRDDLWLALADEPNDKVKLTLLMADKKIAETEELIKSGKTDLALESGREALDKLKYSKQIASLAIEQNNLDERIFQAGYAYKMILGAAKPSQGEGREKYNKLIEELDKWNEEQRKEKEVQDKD